MNTTEDLAAKIERLVRDHISEVHRSASAAVARAFASAAAPAKQEPKKRSRRASQQRRRPEELAAVAERLYTAVCDMPGETMAVLAERVGATVRELNRPMNSLRRAGRLRAVGVRNQTRYFPAVNGAADARAR